MMIRMDFNFLKGAARDIADLANNVRATSAFDEMKPLAANFVPGPKDVICARGKEAFSHPGNRRFRLSVSMNLERYSKATTKLDKSLIVSAIVDSVRQAAPDGGFIKKTGEVWFEVGDHVAREKVGQSFRDLLHTKYKSSTKAKKRRRQVEQAQLGDDVDDIMRSAGSSVAEKLEEITSQAKREAVPDSRMNILFNQANSELLQQITGSHKNGATVYKQEQVIDVEPIRFADAMSANGPPVLPSKREQVIDVEPIRFEDAMSAVGPPALLSYTSMDRVFRRHSLESVVLQVPDHQLPTGEALTHPMPHASSEEEEPVALD